MKRIIVILLAFLLSTGLAQAVMLIHAPLATYTGPGDAVSGAAAWYGLRAYNAAYAATPGLAVNIRRASDNVACDFDVATSGGFGATTATCNSSTQGGVSYGTFVGSDGTASCTLAGTTGACTGASGTVHVNDIVTGTGLTQPCIVATASNTAPTIEIAGTTTSCGTISVAETFTFQVAGFLPEAYDQTGNGNHVLQATAGAQPQLLPNCGLAFNNLPCMVGNGSSTGMVAAANMTSLTAPYSASVVAERTGGFTSNSAILATYTYSIQGSLIEFNSSANQVLGFAGNGLAATANDNVWHLIQTVFNNGSLGIVNVDGAQITGDVGNTATGATAPALFFISPNARWLKGYIGEAGFWAGGFSSGNQTSLCHNQYLFYNTATSC